MISSYFHLLSSLFQQSYSIITYRFVNFVKIKLFLVFYRFVYIKTPKQFGIICPGCLRGIMHFHILYTSLLIGQPLFCLLFKEIIDRSMQFLRIHAF